MQGRLLQGRRLEGEGTLIACRVQGSATSEEGACSCHAAGATAPLTAPPDAFTRCRCTSFSLRGCAILTAALSRRSLFGFLLSRPGKRGFPFPAVTGWQVVEPRASTGFQSLRKEKLPDSRNYYAKPARRRGRSLALVHLSLRTASLASEAGQVERVQTRLSILNLFSLGPCSVPSRARPQADLSPLKQKQKHLQPPPHASCCPPRAASILISMNN